MSKQNSRIYLSYSTFSALIILYGFIINYKVLGTPGYSCMFRSIFVIPCVGCGGSHAIQSLIKGNYADAFGYNALISIVFLLAVLVFVSTTIDILFKQKFLVRIHTLLMSSLRDKKLSMGIAGALIIFWVYHIWSFRL